MPKLPLSKFRKLRADAQFILEEHPLLHNEHQFTSLLKVAHFLVVTFRSFFRNHCPVRAAALSFTTVLALVPLLAVGVSISTSLLKQEGRAPIDRLIDTLVSNIAPALNLTPDVTDEEEASINRAIVVGKIKEYIDNFQSGTLGATAIIALIFVGISLLSTIEATFNDMWGVEKGRGWISRTVHYWAALTLGPVFLVLAIGLTSARQFSEAKGFLHHLPLLGNLVFYILPYIILSLTCALIYLLMPNTRVDWKAALLGGVVGGCLLQLNNAASFLYVNRVVTYNALYGSLSLVPLILIGLYIAWLIVLLGGQVAYAFQNRAAYIQERQAERINQLGREFVALRIMVEAACRFDAQKPPPNSLELAEKLAVPLRLVTQVVQNLVHHRLLLEVNEPALTFAPARPLEQITEQDILRAMRTGQGQELATAEDASRNLLRSQLELVQAAEKQVAGQVSLRDLLAHLAEADPVNSESAPKA